jgi:hypothetical protein
LFLFELLILAYYTNSVEIVCRHYLISVCGFLLLGFYYSARWNQIVSPKFGLNSEAVCVQEGAVEYIIVLRSALRLCSSGISRVPFRPPLACSSYITDGGIRRSQRSRDSGGTHSRTETTRPLPRLGRIRSCVYHSIDAKIKSYFCGLMEGSTTFF